jgi:tetrahydromethanopterin S-methyltransferase subunit A
MSKDYYPWGGEFTVCTLDSNTAVVLLNTDYTPSKKVAVYGPLKTENIGIEKIVANVISNPNIRFLVICGAEIRGHRSGESLVCLNKYGIDDKNRIKNAPGAIPFIENLDKKAINRFQKQIKIVDLIENTDKETIDIQIKNLLNTKTEPMDKPYIAIKIVTEKKSISDKKALHSKIKIDYLGKIKKRGE